MPKFTRFPDADEMIVNATPGDVAGNTGRSAKYHLGWKWYVNGLRMHEYLRELKEVFEPYKGVVVGEMPHVSDIDEIIKTVGHKDGELRMIFIFDVFDLDNVPRQGRLALGDWEVRDLVKSIENWQTLIIEREV